MKNNTGWKCIKCGSLNITIDVDTGNYLCNDCGSDDKPKDFNFEEYKNDNIEKEETEIAKMRILGTRVKVDPDIIDVDDLNDFTGMGL